MLTDTFLLLFLATHDKLLALGERVTGRSYTAADFTRLIRRQFPATDFSFKTQRDYAVDPDSVIVAGYYDPWEDKEMLPCITITLCYHPLQENYFIDLLNWKQFSFDLAECIGHELVHQDQQRRGRRPALKSYISNHPDESRRVDQQYLGAEEEIEAYGFSIAVECAVLEKQIYETPMWQAYEEAFDRDPVILLKLQKQVNHYLTRMEYINEQTTG